MSKSLWENAALALQFTNKLQDPVCVLDQNTAILEGNNAFFSFLNTDRETALRTPLREFSANQPRLAPLLDFVTVRAHDRDFVTINDYDGYSQSTVLTAIALVDDEGAPILAIQIEDISDMVREKSEVEAEKLAVQDRADTLARLNEELEGFSYSVAHDLRAPLRFIDRFAYLLLERHSDDLSSEGLQYAEQIREGARQMAQLIEDLLEFSRATGHELRRETFNLTQLVAEVIDTVEHDIEDRQVKFELEDLGECYGDPALLKQVLFNLLWNAVKFTRPRAAAEISVRHKRIEGESTYIVADNGVGFDSESADRLFTVFRRFHQTDQFEGSGVGLAVVRRIINRHGGEVWAESEVGKGATFYFTLKRADTSLGDRQIHGI